jgi:rSAM/selenodomain-associated transferase 2
VATGSPPDISVIIPVLNDAEALDLALGSTQDYTGVECIVVDGGSSDESAEVAQSRGVKVLHSPPGRARQMNAGAEVAEGRFLLFLHADTRLPEGFDGHVRQILTGSGVAAGAFQLQIDAPSARLRLIEKAANWRSRYLQMPYGDQAIFLRKELFCEMGGFPDLPIMEDFQLIRRLQGEGRIVIAPAAVVTSARRWKKLGALRTTLLNQSMILGFYLGLEPARLARWYGAKRANPKFQIPNSKQTRN